MNEEVLLDEATFVVVDVETTGMSPISDRITEIAMMKVRNGQIIDEFSTLVNPLVTIPAFITALEGFAGGFWPHTPRREREIELTNNRLCTVKLSHRILPFLPSKSLAPVARHLDIAIPQRHRASGDAYATAHILIKFLAYLKQKYALRTVGEILTFQDLSNIPVN